MAKIYLVDNESLPLSFYLLPILLNLFTTVTHRERKETVDDNNILVRAIVLSERNPILALGRPLTLKTQTLTSMLTLLI